MRNQFLIYLITIYSYGAYFSSYILYKFCNMIIKYYPEKLTPDQLFSLENKNINIQNIQYGNKDNLELIDITKKGKILIKLLWDNKLIDNGGFMLQDFINFLNDCIIIYIDYKIKNGSKTINIKKIIDTKNYQYIHNDGNTPISTGEIIF